MVKKKAWIGADPGKSGCLVIQIENEEPTFFKIPLLGNEIDILELQKYMENVPKNYNAHCVLENVHSIFGASAGSNFNFGFNYGILEALLVANRIPYTKVQPKEWQKVCFQGIAEIREPSKTVVNKKGVTQVKLGKVKTKEMSILAAKRLYPNFSLIPTARSRKEDSNISDALLMMHYCKRLY